MLFVCHSRVGGNLVVFVSLPFIRGGLRRGIYYSVLFLFITEKITKGSGDKKLAFNP